MMIDTTDGPTCFAIDFTQVSRSEAVCITLPTCVFTRGAGTSELDISSRSTKNRTIKKALKSEITKQTASEAKNNLANFIEQK